MTVTILPGKDMTKVKETSCKNCAARLQYVQADVEIIISKDIDGGTSRDHWIKCPGCNADVCVKSE